MSNGSAAADTVRADKRTTVGEVTEDQAVDEPKYQAMSPYCLGGPVGTVSDCGR